MIITATNGFATLFESGNKTQEGKVYLNIEIEQILPDMAPNALYLTPYQAEALAEGLIASAKLAKLLMFTSGRKKINTFEPIGRDW